MIESLQFLRGIGAIIIVLFHCGAKVDQFFPSSYKEILLLGVSGVDIFFIISGFVIYVSTQNYFSLKTFLIKRFIRIFPLYWLMTTLFVLLLLFFPLFFNLYEFDAQRIIKSYLLIPQERYPVLYTGWILYYTVYFYLLYGLIRVGTRRFVIMILSTIFSLSFLSIFVIYPSSEIIKVFTSDILFEFLFGMIVAKLYLKNYRIHPVYCYILIVLGVVLLLISSATIRAVQYGIPWMAIFSGMVLSRRQLAHGYISRIGDGSYSIYLTQPLTIPAAAYFINVAGFTELIPVPLFFLVASAAISIAIGYGVYRFIEKPMLLFLQSRYVPGPLKNPHAGG